VEILCKPQDYSEGLQEDQKIRDCIKNYVQKNIRISSGIEGIACIEIQKRIDLDCIVLCVI
jgi:small subunit ribosomal protein S3